MHFPDPADKTLVVEEPATLAGSMVVRKSGPERIAVAPARCGSARAHWPCGSPSVGARLRVAA